MMKITKFSHACLLVESQDKAALFDPGNMSESLIDIAALPNVDNIIITHEHTDHMHMPLIKRLVEKFPNARITAPASVVDILSREGIAATSDSSEDIAFFAAPHEQGAPLFSAPEQIGVHYRGLFTHPGDSHSFGESKQVLALPVQAPWGSTVRAVNLALSLKPQVVVPIHDWHWNDQARQQLYNRLEEIFSQNDVMFIKTEDGVPFSINE